MKSLLPIFRRPRGKLMIRTDKRRKKERTKKETSDILRYERERDRE